jgi:MFS family permease
MVGMRFVDRIGRKPLLIVGSAGMAFCMLALSVAFRRHANSLFYVALLVSYNASFAFSQGAVAWVYLSELFPFSVRGKGQGYGSFVHWIANAALIWIFPVLANPHEYRRMQVSTKWHKLLILGLGRTTNQ